MTECIICGSKECIESEPWWYEEDLIVTVKCVPCNTEWMKRYVLQQPPKHALTCESCKKRSNPKFVKYDWDYTEDSDGKIEWFVCPHCGAGDLDTNVTYED